jgi:hypothetical protein
MNDDTSARIPDAFLHQPNGDAETAEAERNLGNTDDDLGKAGVRNIAARGCFFVLLLLSSIVFYHCAMAGRRMRSVFVGKVTCPGTDTKVADCDC